MRASWMMVLVGVVACGGGSDAVAPEPTGRAASLVVVEGEDQKAEVGKELPVAVVVRVADAQARSVGSQLINFVVVSGGGTVFAGTAQSDGGGEARERWTLGPTAGVQVLEARAIDQSTGEPIVFARIEAEAQPGPAYEMTAPEYYTQFVGQPLDLGAAVTVRDEFGNALPQPDITVDASSKLSVNGGVLSADGEVVETVNVSVGDLSRVVEVGFIRDLRGTRWHLQAKCRGPMHESNPDSVAFSATTDSVTMGVLPGENIRNGTVTFWLSGTTMIWKPEFVVETEAFPSRFYFQNRGRVGGAQRPGAIEVSGQGSMVTDGDGVPTYIGANLCKTGSFSSFDPAVLEPIQ